MPKATEGTYAELLATAPEALQPIMSRLYALLRELHPETVEVVRLGDRAVTFGVGAKKMSEGYIYLMPHKKWINLGFYKGALLPDPEGLLEGTGAKMRHVKVRSLEETETEAVKQLILAAITERKEALGR